MNTYRFVLFLHIASAVLLIGGSLAGLLARSAVRRCVTARDVAVVLALGRPLSVMNPLSAFSLLGSGIYLASVGHWWTTPWVLVAVVMWMANVAIAKGLVGPVITRLAEQVGAGGGGPLTRDAHVFRRSIAWTFGGDLLVAHDVAILLLMTLRLPWVESLWTLALADGVVLALVWIRGLRSAAGTPTIAGANRVE